MKKIFTLTLIIFAVILAGCSQAGVSTDEMISETITLDQTKAVNGTLTGRITELYYENGVSKHRAFGYAGLFFDGNSPYGGPGAQGYTDADGYFTLSLTPGTHTMRISKMTSSHSIFVSDEYQVTILSAKTTETYIPVLPYEATFMAYHDAGWGKALYLTGQDTCLGNWNTALKMNYQGNGTWSIHLNVPRGVQYKIVKANWTDNATISTANVTWEQGYNHVAHAGLYVTNYVTPQF